MGSKCFDESGSPVAAGVTRIPRDAVDGPNGVAAPADDEDPEDESGDSADDECLAASTVGLQLVVATPTRLINDLDDWHFAAIAGPLGGDGRRVTSRAELAAALEDAAAVDAGAGGGDMVAGLMSPMLQMLGTLGTGLFQGLNPSQMFQPITQAFQQGAQSLQGLMSQMGQGSSSGWSGLGATGTVAKTAETVANGAAVSAQGAALGTQGTTAGADTGQAHARLVELIAETQHRLDALSGALPWSAPAMGETAGEATGRALDIIGELEAALTAQAGTMTATGAAVPVAEAPTQMMSMLGPMMQIAMSMIGPGIQMATMPLTMGSQLLTQGVQAGTQAAHPTATRRPSRAAGPHPLSGPADRTSTCSSRSSRTPVGRRRPTMAARRGLQRGRTRWARRPSGSRPVRSGSAGGHQEPVRESVP